jgi:5'-nucleotidase
MPDALRVLVTNDDGIDSVGLHRLAAAADARGLHVVVAAPQAEYSGMSAALTATEDRGRIPVARQTLPGIAEVPAHAVAASPAFIVLLAVRGAFGPPPDLVLSGINRGPNLGAGVLHSGTVGAALTAVAAGRRAMAVSLDVNWVPAGAQRTGKPWDGVERFDVAAGIAADLLPLVTGPEEVGFVLNVNVPNLPTTDLRGVRRASLASFGAVQAAVHEAGEGFLRMTVEQVDAAQERDSDEARVAEGYVAVTPIRPLGEASEVSLDGLADLIGPSAGVLPE